MTPDITRVDLVLHYAILVAGEEDDFADRQLGPIHLIKYVYLADLLHAQQRGGETLTGVDWQFYKFGPWSQAVNERIEPALRALGAQAQRFESQFEDKGEWVRWNLRNEQLLEQKQGQIPVFVAPSLKRLIHRFGKDTPSLLEYVYNTPPMLKAAPGETLDFSQDTNVREPEPAYQSEPRLDDLSNKKQKAFIEKRKQLRARLAASRASSELINPVPNPRYDAVYDAGMEWLDSLAGEQIAPLKGIATFDDSVWKSKARNPDEIP